MFCRGDFGHLDHERFCRLIGRPDCEPAGDERRHYNGQSPSAGEDVESCAHAEMVKPASTQEVRAIVAGVTARGRISVSSNGCCNGWRRSWPAEVSSVSSVHGDTRKTRDGLPEGGFVSFVSTPGGGQNKTRWQGLALPAGTLLLPRLRAGTKGKGYRPPICLALPDGPAPRQTTP